MKVLRRLVPAVVLAGTALVPLPGIRILPYQSALGMETTAAPLVETAGIPVVTTIDQGASISDTQNQAFSDAWVFAMDHPDDVGYPWIDPTTNEVVLSYASAAGLEVLKQWSTGVPVATSLRSVKFSVGRLETIKHEAISLRLNDVPGAENIVMTAPDEKANRVVITVSAASLQLFSNLADRYGTEAIAVRLDPSFGVSTPNSRLYDYSPFWGGARIYAPTENRYCSDSFSWHVGSASGNAILTAAHCVWDGGSIRIGDTNSPIVGTVQSGTEENWKHGVGTVYYQGQTTYRGDAALIRLDSSHSSGPSIYRGTGTTSSHVVSGGYAYMARDDLVYVGGQAGNETGAFRVDNQHTDVWYSATGETVRNVTIAQFYGDPHPCPISGDSGGSVFAIVTGGVRAAGTYSGQYGVSNCTVVYTEAYDSYLALPGAFLKY
jgi:hypothetical protein